MSPTVIGMAVGAVLAITWATLGFWPFVLVAAGIAIGAGVGRLLEGRLDLRAVADALRGRRTS